MISATSAMPAEALWASFAGRCILSNALFTLGLLACWRWPREWPLRRQWLLLLALAIGVRIFVWPIPVSDDLQRYLWEGRLVRLGISPYADTADAPQFARLRDARWEAMNHKDKLTVYPPLAELTFAALGAITDEPWIYKLAFTLAELAVLPLLTTLGGRERLRFVALYAVNPVPVLSFAGEAHFDSLMILATVAAVFAWERDHRIWAWALLAIAVQMKVAAVFLAWPFWAQGDARSRRGAFAFAAILIATALPFASSLPNLVRGLTSFSTATSGNGFLHYLLEHLTGSKALSSGALALLFGAIVFSVGTKTRPMSRAAMQIFGAFLLCASTVTFWYPAWGLPFATLHSCPPFWVLSTLDVLYFAAWKEQAMSGSWEHPWWAYWALWTPVFISLAVWLRRYTSAPPQLDPAPAVQPKQ
ncbi:MAG: glycosyltransferase 87 family protein [Chthoniobacteraceae bacterium]